jgi:hypothetical protein
MISLDAYTIRRTPLITGFILWLLLFAGKIPFSPYANEQVHILLLAAPLFLLPSFLYLKGYTKESLLRVLIAAALFSLAFQVPKGALGALLVIPWLLVALYEVWQSWRYDLELSLMSITALAANIFWLVAAAWAIPDRLGYSPLDYDPVIILLTVVHFHYAGYILLQLYLLGKPYWTKAYGRFVGILLLIGMPMVAIGISATQVGLPVMIESLTVTIMALGGIGVGLGYLHMAWKEKKVITMLLWMISGLCLLVGMSLAMLYGWRFHHDYQWLSIPWMYAVHGTFNSMGFALWLVNQRKGIESTA